nr:MAG TPA: hypothetical protein [Caudoviricetes sp.]
MKRSIHRTESTGSMGTKASPCVMSLRNITVGKVRE